MIQKFISHKLKNIKHVLGTLVFLGSLFFILGSFTPDDFRLINSLPFSHVKLSSDRFGNAYVIVENQLLQFDSLGKPKANYAEANSGKLTSVDAGNPLKILLFYRDFAQLHLLNNKLAKESIVELRNAGIMQPMVVCQSALDGYWIFDNQDFSLKKMDLNLRIVFQSGNMNQTLGYSLDPESITEANESVYINNPATGILVFDKFGSYYKTIPITEISSFQVIEKNLLYVKNNMLLQFNFSTLDEHEIILPAHDSLLSARFEQQKLFLLTTGSLTFYSY
ncbi:MAG: hypothetical protein ABI763_08090 [Bacteroidota bacterium]